MTQEELTDKMLAYTARLDRAKEIVAIINQHVKEVIGEVPYCDENCKRKGIVHEAAIDGQQKLYDEQMKRAGLE